uniref:Uncharacterized protein n=1 Tax=Salix viminalis TaxID=40686 RepID=A0A6N2L9Z2_SALVM
MKRTKDDHCKSFTYRSTSLVSIFRYPFQNHCPCLAYVAITLISMDSQIFNDFHEHRHLRFDLIYHKFHSIFFSDSKVGIVQE